MDFALATRRPRLALARDQHNAWHAEREQRLHKLTSTRHRLERLVAHRELQLLRAGAKNKRPYVAKRAAKLADAQASLAAVTRQIDKALA